MLLLMIIVTKNVYDHVLALDVYFDVVLGTKEQDLYIICFALLKKFSLPV